MSSSFIQPLVNKTLLKTGSFYFAEIPEISILLQHRKLLIER